jgi:hypothetical protein
MDVILPTTTATVPTDVAIKGLASTLNIRILVGVMPQLFCNVCGWTLKDTE